jgi:site-specific recombinase XerD
MATNKVTIGWCKLRGERRARVRYWQHGKPRREFFQTKAEAEARAEKIREDRERAGAAWSDLSPRECQQLMAAWHEARAAGVDLLAAIRSARPNAGAGAAPMVKTVIAEMVLAKKQGGRDSTYVDELEVALGHLFNGLEEHFIDQISLAQVESILNSKSLASRSTVRARLSTLFKFAIRRGYRVDNPCARVEPVTYHKPAPKVFTISEVKTAVGWLKKHAPHGLAWFALSTFCGLRPEEAEKTHPQRDIDFKAGLVKVEKQTTKVRQRRVVYPRAEAMAFLKWALKHGGELPLNAQRRRVVISGKFGHRAAQVHGPKSKAQARKYIGLRGALGWKQWPKDITRHTAASYWLGAGATAGEVAEALGNSEKVLKKDYKALVTRAEARQFWRVVKGLADRRRFSLIIKGLQLFQKKE